MKDRLPLMDVSEFEGRSPDERVYMGDWKVTLDNGKQIDMPMALVYLTPLKGGENDTE